MSEFPSKAIFLSYASQDAEAARRICEALRSGGVEVWFDADGGLETGDEWDAKIRRQIKECVLFLPLISASTQSRHEGYFRIEWELAAERAMGFASGVPFILPIVIDATRETDALVPDRFRKVQWTRVPGGAMSPDVQARFLKLWSHRIGALAHESKPGKSSSAVTVELAAAPAAKSPLPTWLVAVLGAAMLALIAFVALRPAAKEARPPAPAPAVAETKPAPPTAPAVKAKSIAVLPFRNLSPDKDNDFFAEGVSEDVLTNLGKIRDLKVISQTSVVQFRDQAQVNLRKISAELGVATVLRGSVRRAANKVKVSVQLLDARSDEQLWSNDYEKELSDIFAIQAAIAQEIARALKATLLPREQSQIARRPTENQEAYDLFLRARPMVSSTDLATRRERYEGAIALLGRALVLDPNFAEAYLLLSIAHGHMYRSSRLDPTPARLAKLKEVVDAATRAAPDLPETRVVRGNLYFFGLEDFEHALAEYRAAQADLPNNAEVCRRIAFTERRLGRWHDTLVYLEKALDLDPLDESSAGAWVELLMRMRRFSVALQLARRLESTFPNLKRTYWSEGLKGIETASDVASLREQLRLDQSEPTSAFSLAVLDGNPAAASRIVQQEPAVGYGIFYGPVSFPGELRLATLAFFRGDQAATRSLGDQALAKIETMKLSPRLEPATLMGKAAALALAGRTDEALRDARAAMARGDASDKFDALNLRDQLGQIYVILGRTEDALATLRDIFSGASLRGPMGIRTHPIWSRLKDDPRFEEILRSAKPL